MKCPKCGTEFFGDKCPVCGYEPTEYDCAIETLMSLTGVGRKRAEELYKAGFTSIDKILESSEDELTKVHGIGRELARRIREDAEKIVRKEKSYSEEEESESVGIVICPNCGAVVPANLDKCPRCGTPLKTAMEETKKEIEDEKEEQKERLSPDEGELLIGDVVVCPNCGALVPKGSLTCPVCGADLRNVKLEEPKPMEDPTEVLKRVFGVSALPAENATEEESEVDIRICPNCGAIVINRDTCPVCGTPVPKIETKPVEEEIDLSEKLRICPNCGAFVSPSAKVCPVCGSPLPEEKEKEEEVGISLAELRSIIPQETTEEEGATEEISVEDLEEIESIAKEPSELEITEQPAITAKPSPEMEINEEALDEILTTLEGKEEEIGVRELEEIGKSIEEIRAEEPSEKIEAEKVVERERETLPFKEIKLGFMERLNNLFSNFGTRHDILSFSPLFASLIYLFSVGFLTPSEGKILYFSTGFFMALLGVLGGVEAYISGKTWKRISHILGFTSIAPLILLFIYPHYIPYIMAAFFSVWSYIHAKYTVNYWFVIAAYSVLFVVFPDQCESVVIALAFAFGMHLIWRLKEVSLITPEETKEAKDVYSEGIRAFMEKRYYDAIYFLKKALELRPNDTLALNTLGLAYARIGNDKLALETFRKIVSFDPKYKYAWNNMGNVYARMGDYEKAIECYRKALKIDPDYSDALLNLGYVMIRTGSYSEAVRLAEKIKAIS